MFDRELVIEIIDLIEDTLVTIVHHYFDVDADIVFQTLKNDIPRLLSVLKHIRLDLCR